MFFITFQDKFITFDGIIITFMEKVIKKITEIRNKMGYSYETMATELDISPSTYRKIETGETKLSVERLLQISEVLNSSVIDLLGVKSEQYNQTYHDNAVGYQQKELHLYKENKEITQELLNTKNSFIEKQQEEINFLRTLLDKK
jgi:transcriptional regulator with XRE-family HTH domain